MMSDKMASSTDWTFSQLLKVNRSNPAWNDLTRVMRTLSKKFGVLGKRSENYETVVTQVMNHFDALKPLVNDEVIRTKIGGHMTRNVQRRKWFKNKEQLNRKTLSKQKKLMDKKKKGCVSKGLNKKKIPESQESPVKVRQSSRKSTGTVVAPEDSESPVICSKLLNDAEKLLVLRRPLTTWKRMMALMRMTSDNLGIDGLHDEKSSVAIAGIMANFAELRPHMDDVNMQRKIRRQMIHNLTQRLYQEKKKEALDCPPKMKKMKNQKQKKGTLKVKSSKISTNAKEDKPKSAEKELSISTQTSGSAAKKQESTQGISELSIKAKQLLFYRHPQYTYKRLKKMMRQTGDQLGVAGLRSSDGLSKIVQIMEAFPQLQPYTTNVHVLKKLQSQMIMNYYWRERNRMQRESKDKLVAAQVKEDDTENHTSNLEDEQNSCNSTKQDSVSESKRPGTEITEDTDVIEPEEDIPLAKLKEKSKFEKEESFDLEKEGCILGDEKETECSKDEENSVVEEDVSAAEGDGSMSEKSEAPVMETGVEETSAEGDGPDADDTLMANPTENDGIKMGTEDKTGTNKEKLPDTDGDGENDALARENRDVPVLREKKNVLSLGSEPLSQKNSQRLWVGKSTIMISADVKQLLVHHRPFATWKRLRDLMRTTSDDLGLEGLREPAAIKSAEQIMAQIPELRPYKDVIPLQQRLQKQMITNLNQRIWDNKNRKGGTHQRKENVLPAITRWRQTRLMPVKRKNLKDITENNKIVKQDEVSQKNSRPEPGKCWCQKGRAATWSYNDILHRASGSLPWRHLMNVMKNTSAALNVTKKSCENYRAAVDEVINHFPGLKKLAGNPLILEEVGKKMVKNVHERRRRVMKRAVTNTTVSSAVVKRSSRLTLRGKEKDLKRIDQDKTKTAIPSKDQTSENTENKEQFQPKRTKTNLKKCWCQKKDAPVWTYDDIFAKKIGNKAWFHFTKIMQLTAHRYKVTRQNSAKNSKAVTEVLNHFTALRPYVRDAQVRRHVGKKMIRNYFRLPKHEGSKGTIMDTENTESVSKDESPKIGVNRKKCWCQKRADGSWTYKDLLVRKPGNIAWAHFTKVMQHTARSHNITKRKSEKYHTAVNEVMEHFTALRPFINDKAVRYEIGKKMIANYCRVSKRASLSQDKDAKQSATEKTQPDVGRNAPKSETENTEIPKECESNDSSINTSVKRHGFKKCWCQKGASSTWTCNELFNRTPGNLAWKHFTKVLLDVSNALNVTKKSSENYQTAVNEVMNHFPALRTLVNDISVQQKVGYRMVNNSYERARRHSIRERTKSESEKGTGATTEKSETGAKKTDSIKESQIFEVEAVLKYAKDLEGGEWYYVKWAGYASDQNTWEPKEHLTGCSKLLKKFHHQLKRAKLTHTGRKRKLSDEGLVVGSKKPKCPKPMSPVSTESVRAMVQEELRNWAISLNYICTDTAPIVVENDVDFEGPPTEFNYINDYISGAGVKIPNDPLVGCSCESCSEEELDCCPQNSGVKFAYNRLKHIRVKPGTPIYECNKYCKCGEKCPNRVVQLGRKYPMAIFRTSNGRGWGVKTLVDIRRNTFVMEYVGEVITNEEAERRGKEYDANGRTYLFDLDYNDDDCPFTVDAGKSGNISHFVNHSCEPNLVVYGVWVNCVDPRLPRIALFASRDIKAGEELTFDYQMTGEVGDLSPDVKVQHVTCRCGASNCRGFLV